LCPLQFPLRDANNSVDCSNMDLDKIRLYVRPEVVDQVRPGAPERSDRSLFAWSNVDCRAEAT
jgi:hypothetical protein